MITVMDSVRKPMNEKGKLLDPQLWHACAGGMVKMPSVNSKVFYFPQGHAEHACKNVEFSSFSRIPPLILCRVVSIRYLADTETDEVYAKLKLFPCKSNECDVEDESEFLGFDKNESQEKSNSFAKTLTQSDANNGGGFSVPRYCAETLFPRLDYTGEPPVQNILAKDVHGEIWKFRHVYRGTPRRHLLTTGWSNFVNHKKLVAGDSIVFLRAENGDLCIGIRRAKRGGIGCGHEAPSGWRTESGNNVSSVYGGFSGLLGEDESRFIRNTSGGNGNSDIIGKVGAESVVEAASLAASGQAFEVVYYPRASTPDFVVKASAVKAAMRVQWHPGMRFKMPFETEDSSRISWFMGTVSSVQADDPIYWPNSPWRLLQVAWDEPDLLHNVKRVSPWLVEVASSMPGIHIAPFSLPRKKPRIPQSSEFPFIGQYSMSPFLSNNNPLSPSRPLCCLTDNNIPAGIQGARHPHFGPSFEPLFKGPIFNRVQTGFFPPFHAKQLDHAAPSPLKNHIGNLMGISGSEENVSCLLTMANSSQGLEPTKENKRPSFVLFGQPILTEQQISLSSSMDTVGGRKQDEKTTNISSGSGSAVLQNDPQQNSCDEAFPCYKDQKLDFGLETGHCKVFMESEDVGRTLDLSFFGSYEELHQKLAEMFGLERSEMLSNVLYLDIRGVVKHTGDEPFSVFLKTARRITILSDSASDNVGR